MSTSKQTLSARVPQDIHEDIQRYKETNDLSKSDAIRRVLESGLKSEQDEPNHIWRDVLPETQLAPLYIITGIVLFELTSGSPIPQLIGSWGMIIGAASIGDRIRTRWS